MRAYKVFPKLQPKNEQTMKQNDPALRLTRHRLPQKGNTCLTTQPPFRLLLVLLKADLGGKYSVFHEEHTRLK